MSAEVDPSMVSPGLPGFITMFLLALATMLLMFSMVHHLRKVRYGPEPEDLAAVGNTSDVAAAPRIVGTAGDAAAVDPPNAALEGPRPGD
jgi:hypothetical protein